MSKWDSIRMSILVTYGRERLLLSVIVGWNRDARVTNPVVGEALELGSRVKVDVTESKTVRGASHPLSR